MRKIMMVLVAWGLLLFVRQEKVWGYDLTLTKVGTLSTLGTDYSLVNYSETYPIIEGTSSPSAQVQIKNNLALNYVTASASGMWQYLPSSLNTGDNSFVITSGNQVISFVLRYNSTNSGTVATPAAVPNVSELPDSGVWEYYLPAILGGMGVFFLGRYGKKQMQKWEKGD